MTILYGRNPAKFPAGLQELPHYSSLPRPPAKVAIPEVPRQVDGTQFGVDGNDSYGDCGAAGLNHGFMAAASATRTTMQEIWPTSDEVVSYYLQYTGGNDTGVVLSDFLAYVRKHSFYEHSITAYAPVNIKDLRTLQYVIYGFTFAFCGINVTQQMEHDFFNSQPWTMESLYSPVAGRHCVTIVGYDSLYLYCVTWGKIQAITYSAWHHMADEAWCIIPGEFQSGDGRGINLTLLKADLAEIGK